MLDAKYKRLDNYSSENIDRNDKHQIVSYAYTLNAKKAGFIYPIESDNYKDSDYIGNLNNKYNNTECQIYKYALKIPSAKNNNFENIKDFASSMRVIEEELLNTLEH